MAFIHAGRVAETTISTGTGNLTLAGAKTGFRTFASQLAANDYCYYVIQHQSLAEWEYGIGQLVTGVLVRSVILGSSNAGSVVTLSAGTKDVFISPAAQMHNALSNLMFGDGSDGDVTVSTTSSISRDMYYRNLTLNGTAYLQTNGYRIFVSEILDLSNAPTGAIAFDSTRGNNASGTTGGTGAAAVAGVTVGGKGAGGAGANGGTAAGASGTAAANQNPANGGAGAVGGASGTGSGGGAGTGGAGGTISNSLSIRRWTAELIRGVSLIAAGSGGGGGAGGAGDGTAGGGGGGGASSGGCVFVSARIIKRGGSTAAGAIRAIGYLGGNGASPAAGNRGGGGGGGGSGGGWVFVAYLHLTGTAATNALDASGGAGGNGATGTGTGTAGSGGTGGAGGRITKVDLSTNTVSDTTGSAGSAPSGVTGGAGNTFRVNL